ncbi:MAG: bacterial Ig-like domain-containing protein [Prevotella sp.]|nr:bacterial Ig-like domain-containing protein [Prevotella sp.]
MKQKTLIKHLFLLIALVIGGVGNAWGEDVEDVLTVKGWANYSGTCETDGTDHEGTSATTSVKYIMQAYSGSSGQVRGNQSNAYANFSCRNSTTYTGYYIKEVKLKTTDNSGTLDGSTSGRSVVYFGTTAYASPKTSAPTGTVTNSNENASGKTTLTWTNSDTSKTYFILYNLKTSGTAAGGIVTVTWAPILDSSAPAATLSTTSLDFGNVNFGSTKEMTFTVTPANLTGNLTLSYDNDKYTVSPTSIAKSATTAQTITVTAAPTALGDDMDGTITISGGGLAASKTVTLTTTVTDPNANDGSKAKPFTVAEAIANTPASGTSDNYYIKGIVSAFYNTDIVSDGTNYRYYISDDSTTSNQLLVYKGTLNGSAFSNANDLLLGDKVTIYGKLTMYQSAPEIASGNNIVSLTRKEVSSIALSGTYTTTFVEGSEFNHDGVIVTATYSDETHEDVTAQATFSEPNMSQVGVQTITVTYNGKTTTYDITITAAPSYTITYYVRGEENSVQRKENATLNLDTPANINQYMKFQGWSESEDVSGTPTFVPNSTVVTGDMTLYAIFGKSAGESTYNKVTATNDVTDGEYLIVNETASVAFDGSLTTLDATNDVISVTINEGVIEATDATNAATFTYNTTTKTLKSASGYYIGKTANSNGLDSSTSTAYTNTIEIDENDNAVITASGNCTLKYNKASDQNRFRYYKSGQQTIQLYKKVASEVDYSLGENEEICVTSAEWATATTPAFAVDFDANANVYIATSTGDNITLTKISDAPANTPVVVNAPSGSYTMTPKATATSNVSENKLESSDGSIVGNYVDADNVGDYYVLGRTGGEIGFAPLANGTTLAAGKAYIPANLFTSAKEFYPFAIDDETTGINSIENGKLNIEGAYNLNGQKVSGNYKGIVIINGKKYLNK